MTTNNKKQSVALSSVLASFFLTIIKLIVGLLTASMGILSEAAHSALDLGAALLTYFSVKISDKPADESHPYGHGKVESVSALIETGLLFITSVWIIYEAVKRLIDKNIEVQATWYAFAVIIVSIIVDISRSRALKKVAKETKSQALEADALHFSSDIYSSAVVLLGLIFVLFGLNGADAIAALGVAIFVTRAGYCLGKRTIDVLIDSAPAGIAEIVKNIVENTDGIIAAERVRVRSLGPSVFIDLIINVSRKLPLERVKEIIANLEKKIKEKVPEADLIVHSQPVQMDTESIIESIQVLATRHDLAVHDIVADNLNNRQFISYDLEVPEHLTIYEAHQLASHLEESIKKEIGGEPEINTHIEPLKSEAIFSTNVEPLEISRINRIINKIVETVPSFLDVHNILTRKIENKLFITLHCSVSKQTSLSSAHQSASRLEYLIKDKLPEVARVVVHLEPK